MVKLRRQKPSRLIVSDFLTWISGFVTIVACPLIPLNFIIMDERMKNQKFLQLQFCLLLLVCALLPDLGSFIGVSSLDIPVLCCQLIGIVGSGLALLAFHKSMGGLPTPFVYIVGAGLLLALLVILPGVPQWLGYIAIIVLLVSLYMAKNSLGIQWNSWGSQGAYFILFAILMHVYDSIGDNTLTGIAALVGFFMYFKGLGILKDVLDDTGVKGVSKLKTAVILGVVAVILGWIPLLGGILAGILLLVAFIFEYIGYGALKQSVSLGMEGRIGAGKLRTSMIILVIASVINLFPMTGVFVGIISMIALWFIFSGWSMILLGMEDEMKKWETSKELLD